MLLANLAGLLPEVQANLDLLLRWAVLRICDGNMQVRWGRTGGAKLLSLPGTSMHRVWSGASKVSRHDQPAAVRTLATPA